MFQGFSQETIEFFVELGLHNERQWFEAHHDAFDKYVKNTFRELAEEATAIVAARFPEHALSLHISRIYRDARRLHGHGPYKDHLWFSLKEQNGLLYGPMFWFELGAMDYSRGVGFYSASAEEMERYRALIRANPARIQRLDTLLSAQDTFQMDGAFYARPKGDLGPVLNPWYNRKQFSISCTRTIDEEILSPNLPSILADDFSFLMPYYVLMSECCLSDSPDDNTERRR